MILPVTESLLNTKEASETLGISDRRVRELADLGSLKSFKSGRRIYVTMDSVNQIKRRYRKAGRPFAPRMAFAALYMISGEHVNWLKATERYRLREHLRSSNIERLLSLCGKRALTQEYWCRDSRLGKLLMEIRSSAATGDLAEHFGLTKDSRIEGYVPVDILPEIVKSFRLRDDFTPATVKLHVTSFLPNGEGTMPLGVCAADLAESEDVRERNAGKEKLRQLLEHYQLNMESRP
ncbi:helix-turn-helix domain-containing protein [Bifidobacterium simiarum]|uniref:helix-turn-helix domain-containing protein n=1 Tax=Bifidobacterium simiarum TaxID=2045441 RepID=UPI001BDCEE5F|nr:helix-turn-helix domain-containing protein [Bifidobacterium simiarum]MBT1167025.1 helix-turn-helix domain-containing protein [Bifidobacterium simiarum]